VLVKGRKNIVGSPRLLKIKRLVDGPSEKLDDLLGYLEENWDRNLWVEDTKRQDWSQRGPGSG